MKRLLWLLLALSLHLQTAQAQSTGASGLTIQGPFNPVISAFKYLNVTTDATIVVKNNSGVLHNICINTVAATETITIYDNVTNSGTKIGTITLAAGDEGKCFLYNIQFNLGLTLVTAVAASDITVSWL